ncbi:MAG TPA: cell division protein FtsZ [Allosphingosinicella sp.]|jgi:cell division protein FtsZ
MIEKLFAVRTPLFGRTEAAAPVITTPRIVVVGAGGAGCNALRHMIRNGVSRVDFVAADSDARALEASEAPVRVLIGEGGGLAAPIAALEGAQMCFIAAGMGGIAGTRAAAEIAAHARARGILTVAAVTRPFGFEGRRRAWTALRGIEELRRAVDTLIVLPNEKLLRAAGPEAKVTDAFAAADAVLENGVRSITDLIVNPGIVNLDFADVRSIMQGMGKAVLGTGEGTGEQRALDAARAAIDNPLLDGAVEGATHLIVSIVGGEDMRLADIDAAAGCVTARVHPEAQIVWGSAQDKAMAGRIRVSVVATGIEPPAGRALRPSQRRLACRFRRHEAQPSALYGQGFYFSTCRHCGEDMIRSGAKWRTVPAGFRVVWPGSAPAHPRSAAAAKPAPRKAKRRARSKGPAAGREALAGIKQTLSRTVERVRNEARRLAARLLHRDMLMLPRPNQG